MKTRKQINSQIKGLETMQKKCEPGSEKSNGYRIRLNKLKVELDQSAKLGT